MMPTHDRALAAVEPASAKGVFGRNTSRRLFRVAHVYSWMPKFGTHASKCSAVPMQTGERSVAP